MSLRMSNIRKSKGRKMSKNGRGVNTGRNNRWGDKCGEAQKGGEQKLYTKNKK